MQPSDSWSDDEWYLDQRKREIRHNEGFWNLHPGQAQGRIFGGNLCTFNLLQGTAYLPDLQNSILFLEDDALAGKYSAEEFDRNLQSLIQQPGFTGVRGLVIGRFQKKSEMTPIKLKQIIDTKKELQQLPVVANVDFGHTNPIITFPIGGTAELQIDTTVQLKIIEH